jgi:hypothetical protein
MVRHFQPRVAHVGRRQDYDCVICVSLSNGRIGKRYAKARIAKTRIPAARMSRTIDFRCAHVRSWQSTQCRSRRTLVVVHPALLFRNLACGWTKFRGAPVIAPSMNKSSSYSPPAKCYQKNKDLVSMSSRCIENTELALSSSRLSPDRRLFVVQLFSRHTRHLIQSSR